MRRILRFFLLPIVLIGALGAYFYVGNFMFPNTKKSEQGQFIFIPKVANADTVIALLERKNLIRFSIQLRWLMKLKKMEGKNIVPGKYKIEASWSNNRLINHLRAGNGRLDAVVQFHNVQTIAQLAGKMTKELLIDSTEVLSWLNNPVNYKHYGFNENTFLSMFIPNTYFVDVDINTEDLMKRMAKEYKLFWNENRKNKAKSCGLSLSEVVTLASIVYWETKIKEDMPRVAGVYMNRLDVGMPLQADPTLVYALEKMGRGKVKRVLNVDKAIDSPYNTYKNKGLPPGPILIPPVAYVDAVLNYEKHNYYYFVAQEDFSGRSYFSNSYQQHLEYAKRYQKALNEQQVYR